MVERVVDRVEGLEIGDALEVVEHESERRAERRDAVHQLDQGALEDRPGALQPLERSAPKAVTHAFDRRGGIGPEPRRVVVTGVERHPGDAPGALSRHVRAATVFPNPGGPRLG